MPDFALSDVLGIITGTVVLIILAWMKTKKQHFSRHALVGGILALVIIGVPLWSTASLEKSKSKSTVTDSLHIQQAAGSISPNAPFSAPQFESVSFGIFSTATELSSVDQGRKPDIEIWADIFGVEYETMEEIYTMMD